MAIMPGTKVESEFEKQQRIHEKKHTEAEDAAAKLRKSQNREDGWNKLQASKDGAVARKTKLIEQRQKLLEEKRKRAEEVRQSKTSTLALAAKKETKTPGKPQVTASTHVLSDKRDSLSSYNNPAYQTAEKVVKSGEDGGDAKAKRQRIVQERVKMFESKKVATQQSKRKDTDSLQALSKEATLCWQQIRSPPQPNTKSHTANDDAVAYTNPTYASHVRILGKNGPTEEDEDEVSAEVEAEKILARRARETERKQKIQEKLAKLLEGRKRTADEAKTTSKTWASKTQEKAITTINTVHSGQPPAPPPPHFAQPNLNAYIKSQGVHVPRPVGPEEQLDSEQIAEESEREKSADKEMRAILERKIGAIQRQQKVVELKENLTQEHVKAAEQAKHATEAWVQEVAVQVAHSYQALNISADCLSPPVHSMQPTLSALAKTTGVFVQNHFKDGEMDENALAELEDAKVKAKEELWELELRKEAEREHKNIMAEMKEQIIEENLKEATDTKMRKQMWEEELLSKANSTMQTLQSTGVPNKEDLPLYMQPSLSTLYKTRGVAVSNPFKEGQMDDDELAALEREEEEANAMVERIVKRKIEEIERRQRVLEKQSSLVEKNALIAGEVKQLKQTWGKEVLEQANSSFKTLHVGDGAPSSLPTYMQPNLSTYAKAKGVLVPNPARMDSMDADELAKLEREEAAAKAVVENIVKRKIDEIERRQRVAEMKEKIVTENVKEAAEVKSVRQAWAQEVVEKANNSFKALNASIEQDSQPRFMQRNLSSFAKTKGVVTAHPLRIEEMDEDELEALEQEEQEAKALIENIVKRKIDEVERRQRVAEKKEKIVEDNTQLATEFKTIRNSWQQQMIEKANDSLKTIHASTDFSTPIPAYMQPNLSTYAKTKGVVLAHPHTLEGMGDEELAQLEQQEEEARALVENIVKRKIDEIERRHNLQRKLSEQLSQRQQSAGETKSVRMAWTQQVVEKANTSWRQVHLSQDLISEDTPTYMQPNLSAVAKTKGVLVPNPSTVSKLDEEELEKLQKAIEAAEEEAKTILKRKVDEIERMNRTLEAKEKILERRTQSAAELKVVKQTWEQDLLEKATGVWQEIHSSETQPSRSSSFARHSLASLSRSRGLYVPNPSKVDMMDEDEKEKEEKKAQAAKVEAQTLVKRKVAEIERKLSVQEKKEKKVQGNKQEASDVKHMKTALSREIKQQVASVHKTLRKSHNEPAPKRFMQPSLSMHLKTPGVISAVVRTDFTDEDEQAALHEQVEVAKEKAKELRYRRMDEVDRRAALVEQRAQMQAERKKAAEDLKKKKQAWMEAVQSKAKSTVSASTIVSSTSEQGTHRYARPIMSTQMKLKGVFVPKDEVHDDDLKQAQEAAAAAAEMEAQKVATRKTEEMERKKRLQERKDKLIEEKRAQAVAYKQQQQAERDELLRQFTLWQASQQEEHKAAHKEKASHVAQVRKSYPAASPRTVITLARMKA